MAEVSSIPKVKRTGNPINPQKAEIISNNFCCWPSGRAIFVKKTSGKVTKPAITVRRMDNSRAVKPCNPSFAATGEAPNIETAASALRITAMDMGRKSEN